MRKIKILASMTLAVAVTGCASIDGYRLVETDAGLQRDDIGGLPIVVQRPTHAVFVIKRTTYAVARLVDVDVQGRETYEPVGDVDEASISDQPIMLGPSELYAIDIKRPAFGTIDYTVELENYFPTKIGAKLDDKTLDQLRQTALDVLDKLGPGAAEFSKESGAGIRRQQRSVALSLLIFDLATGQARLQAL